MGGAPGQLAIAGALRVLARHRGQGHRRPPAEIRAARRCACRHRGAAGLHRGARTRAGASPRGRRTQALVLFRVPAQHVDASAGRFARHGRHRLPLHGALDGPQHGHLHAYGRRGRTVAGPDAIHRRKACVRQPGRRHLLSFRPAGDTRCRRRQGADYLQDPLQRRGRDDRRPAGRRAHQRTDHHAPDGGGRRRQDRGGDRRAGEVPGRQGSGRRRAGPSSRRTGSHHARVARIPRRVGPGLRPDLRHRKAPAPQAQRLSRSRPARGHQRPRMRGLRRLFRQVQLPVRRAAGNRVWPQAHHQPVQLQQGLLLPERLLPQLRDGRGRQAAQAQGRGRPGRDRCRPAGADARRAGPAVWRVHCGRGWNGRGHHRPTARHGRAPGRQGLLGARYGRPGAEGRRRAFPRRAGAVAGASAEYARRHGRSRPGPGGGPGRGDRSGRAGAHEPRAHPAAAQ
ncbi:hypothetical protein BOFL111202_14710 [Bordetella flabilis]